MAKRLFYNFMKLAQGVTWCLAVGHCLLSHGELYGEYQERFLLGAYAGHETYSTSSSAYKNENISVISARSYLDVTDIGSQKLRFTLDLRDKNDFFDKADRQRLSLTRKNTFQVRQLSLYYPGFDTHLYSTAGRFSPADETTLFVDGAEVGYRIHDNNNVGLFGGLNPRQRATSYLSFNPNSSIVGVYSLMQNSKHGVQHSTYLLNAFITEKEQQDEFNKNNSATKRSYFLHSSSWQPTHSQLLSARLIYDFAPTAVIENIWTNYRINLSPDWLGMLSYYLINPLEYRNQQDVLETLSPSTYEEASAQLTVQESKQLALDFQTLYGRRRYDHLIKAEFSPGVRAKGYLLPAATSYAYVGYRENFRSTDTFIKFGLGWYPGDFELDYYQTMTQQAYKNASTFHVYNSEVSLGYLFSKMIEGSLAIEYVHDESVTITTVFMHVSYRTGSKVHRLLQPNDHPLSAARS